MRYGRSMSEETSRRPPLSRAARSEGPRTTLRLPAALAEVAERLALELGISRNDAILRLATRGARIYEQEAAVAERRAARWAAIVPGALALGDADLPTAEESHEAIVRAREQT